MKCFVQTKPWNYSDEPGPASSGDRPGGRVEAQTAGRSPSPSGPLEPRAALPTPARRLTRGLGRAGSCLPYALPAAAGPAGPCRIEEQEGRDIAQELVDPPGIEQPPTERRPRLYLELVDATTRKLREHRSEVQSTRARLVPTRAKRCTNFAMRPNFGSRQMCLRLSGRRSTTSTLPLAAGMVPRRMPKRGHGATAKEQRCNCHEACVGHGFRHRSILLAGARPAEAAQAGV